MARNATTVKPVTLKAVERIATEYAATRSNVWRDIARATYERLVMTGRKDGKLHITIPSNEHKLAGGTGINTSVRNNPICAARRNKAIAEHDYNHVCINCYADTIAGAYNSLEECLEYNQHILTTRLLSQEEIESLPVYTLYVREEMFGDVSNLLQARNYTRIARYLLDHKVAVWSKNHNIYYHAFELEGKPDNLSYVWSSSHLDEVETIPEKYLSMVDHRFTVATTRESYERLLRETPGAKPCAGISCFRSPCAGGCGAICYNKGTAFDLIELQR